MHKKHKDALDDLIDSGHPVILKDGKKLYGKQAKNWVSWGCLAPILALPFLATAIFAVVAKL